MIPVITYRNNNRDEITSYYDNGKKRVINGRLSHLRDFLKKHLKKSPAPDSTDYSYCGVLLARRV